MGTRVGMPPGSMSARLRRTDPLINWRSRASTFSLGASICTCPISRAVGALGGLGWLFSPPYMLTFRPSASLHAVEHPLSRHCPSLVQVVGVHTQESCASRLVAGGGVFRRCGMVSPLFSLGGCVSPLLSSGSGSVFSPWRSVGACCPVAVVLRGVFFFVRCRAPAVVVGSRCGVVSPLFSPGDCVSPVCSVLGGCVLSHRRRAAGSVYRRGREAESAPSSRPGVQVYSPLGSASRFSLPCRGVAEWEGVMSPP